MKPFRVFLEHPTYVSFIHKLTMIGLDVRAQEPQMECQMYNIMRMEMFDTVNRYSDVTETVLLFGDNSLSIESNEAIFRAVHKYILQTKRFSSRN